MIRTISSWNSVIRRAVNDGDPHKALSLFHQLKQQCPQRPNNLTFPFVVKACSKLSNPNYTQAIHASAVKSPAGEDIYVYTTLVDAYVKCGDLESAGKVFDEMSVRDVASWNAMIMGFSQVGSSTRVMSLFSAMRVDGLEPNAVTLMGLIQSACTARDVVLLTSVHCFGLKFGLIEDVSVANTMISAYAKCGEIRAAETVFDCIDSNSLSVVSWNSLISGFAYLEDAVSAMEIYRRMLSCLFRPDLSTILNLLSSLSQPSFLFPATTIHAHGIKLGCDADTALLNTLISTYSKCGEIGFARQLFDEMTIRSFVTWTVMIGGYSEIGDLNEALRLFREMEISGKKSDAAAAVHLVKSCANVSALEIGRFVHNYVIINGLEKNTAVRNALLDMYAKCGSIGSARRLFSTMEMKDVISWTTMIAGFALNGDFRSALDCFDEMTTNPNQITFLAVLQACAHAGLAEKALEIFDSMVRVYRITPELDHYACVADLLGRRGRVKEALGFVSKMPLKPDAGIWGSLLGACKVHRDFTPVAKYAAERLFELEPSASAPYVEMSNVYASAEEWKEFAGVRAKMRAENVEKIPGRSDVYVGGRRRSFTVEDRFHPEGRWIFGAVDALALQSRDEFDFLCQDVELAVL